MSALDELLTECDACYDDGEEAGNHATYAARAELAALRAEIAKLRELVAAVAGNVPSWNAGKYVEVQIDAETWRDLTAYRSAP